jgi:hypothetical protein
MFQNTGHCPPTANLSPRRTLLAVQGGSKNYKNSPRATTSVPCLPLAFIQPRSFPIDSSWAKKTTHLVPQLPFGNHPVRNSVSRPPVQFRKYEDLLANATTGGNASVLLRLVSLRPPPSALILHPSSLTPSPHRHPPDRKSFGSRTTTGWSPLREIQSPQLLTPKSLPATAGQPDSNNNMKRRSETPVAKPISQSKKEGPQHPS